MAQPLLLTPAPSRRQRMLAPAVTLGVLTAATVALHLRDPHVEGSWGFCPSALLGFWCPGCGGLRAVNDLTHLRLADAASSNLLFVAALPVVLVGLGLWVRAQWRGTTRTLHPRRAALFGTAVSVLVVAFAVLRNLPGLEYLAP